MKIKKYINITVSIIALAIVVLIAFRFCGKKNYTQKDIDAIDSAARASKQEYIDSLNFIRSELSLKQEQVNAGKDDILILQNKIDSLVAKNNTTKQKIRPAPNDTSFVLAPNEYIQECQGCFDLLEQYKKANTQLQFERDGYDSLMRQQSDINEKRAVDLDWENTKLRIRLSQASLNNTRICDTTRKVKLSLIGMFSNPFLPKGGGFGLIYEDKKFNEYGGHVVFTNGGNIYLLNIAKTISFRRKK